MIQAVYNGSCKEKAAGSSMKAKAVSKHSISNAEKQTQQIINCRTDTEKQRWKTRRSLQRRNIHACH